MRRPTSWIPIYERKRGMGESIVVHTSLLLCMKIQSEVLGEQYDWFYQSFKTWFLHFSFSSKKLLLRTAPH